MLLCKAIPGLYTGIDTDRYVVTCIITALRRLNEPDELDLAVSGLNSVTQEYPEWVKVDLKEGDTITIKVINSGFEPAGRVRPTISEEEMLDKKLQYYHRLREELKEHLKQD